MQYELSSSMINTLRQTRYYLFQNVMELCDVCMSKLIMATN